MKKDKKTTDKRIAKCDSPYERLRVEDQIAVDMKCEGFVYRQIARYMKMSYTGCRNAFSAGGRLYEAYVYRDADLKEEYQEKFNHIGDILRDAAVEAAITMRRASRTGGMTGVIAAKDILDRTGFKPTEKIEHSSDPDNPPVIFYIPNNGRDVKPTEELKND